MARLGLLALAAALASPAAAQFETGPAAPPLYAADAAPSTRAAPSPLAFALSLAFDATTWASVGVSTAAPAEEMAALLSRGYYRLEILQLTLLARASSKRLLDLRTRRTKDGRGLRQLAEEAGVPYEGILDRAVELGAEVDARADGLRLIAPVRPGGGP